MSEKNWGSLATPFAVPIFTTNEFKVSYEFREMLKHLDTHIINGLNRVSNNSYVLDMKIAIDLRAFILENVKHYFHEILLVADNVEIYLTQSWVNFNKKKTSHHRHYHPNSIVSGVFYIDGEFSPLQIERPNKPDVFGSSFSFPYKGNNFLNTHLWEVANINSRSVIFPSSCYHSVEENDSDTERISLAFNTFVRGKFSDDILSEINLK